MGAMYREHADVVGRLDAVLKSTGANEWASSTGLQKLAREQSAATGKTNDEIMEMQTVLLGFRSITRDTFGDTTQAIMDMAAVMGGGLVGAANTLGKALDSPVQGMGALSRNGFVFTEQQKEEIKVLEESGRHLEAQRIILGEVQAAFSGAAGAATDAQRSHVAFDNAVREMKVNIGEGWENATVPARKWLTDIINKYNDAIAKKKELEGIGGDVTSDFSAELAADTEAAKNLANLLKTEYIEAFQVIENFAMNAMEMENKQQLIQQDLLRLYKRIAEEKKLEVGFIMEAVGKYSSLIPLVKEASAEIQKERLATDALRRFEIERANAIAAGNKKAREIAATARAEEAAGQKKIADAREEYLKNLDKEMEKIKTKAQLEHKSIASAEIQDQILKARQSAYLSLIDIIGDAGDAEKRIFAELKADYVRQAREGSKEALEENIKQIKREAELQNKSTESAEVQNQILNARISAYKTLIQKIGDARDEEKQALAELQAEYLAQIIATGKRLQDEDIKNLNLAKKNITERAKLEGRVTGNRKTDKEILDAEVQSYKNQLKILRDLIDGTQEEETVRREALQVEWDHYNQLEVTAEKQKENLEELIREGEKAAAELSKLFEESAKSVVTAKQAETYAATMKKQKASQEEFNNWALLSLIGINREKANIVKQGIRDESLAKANAAYIDFSESRKIAKAKYEAEKELYGPGSAEEQAAFNKLNQIYADAWDETARKVRGINEQLHDDLITFDEDWLKAAAKNIQEYLDVFSSASSSITSIWSSLIDNELEAALRKNDAIEQSEEERAAKEEELMHTAAEEKYKVEQAQYANNLIIAAGQAAMAVLTAMAQMGIPGAIVAGALGLLQVGAVAAAIPQRPRYHEGGVAGGQGEVPAILMAGETITTPAQFQNIMDAFAQVAKTGTGTGGSSIQVSIENNAAAVAKVRQPSIDQNALRLVIDQIVNDGMATGRYDSGAAQKSYRDQGIMLE
jgi:hypothetical protein